MGGATFTLPAPPAPRRCPNSIAEKRRRGRHPLRRQSGRSQTSVRERERCSQQVPTSEGDEEQRGRACARRTPSSEGRPTTGEQPLLFLSPPLAIKKKKLEIPETFVLFFICIYYFGGFSFFFLFSAVTKASLHTWLSKRFHKLV